MSHIPSSAMPHAHASDDGLETQTPGERPKAEPTTATPPQPAPAISSANEVAAAGPSTDDASEEPPLAAAGPGTATGARAGSNADATALATGGAATGDQSGVDGTVTAEDHGPRRDEGASDRRSPALIAAMVLGGLAALGGLVAAALPLLRDDGARKGKKAKKRKM